MTEVDGALRPEPAAPNEAEERLAGVQPVVLRPRTWLVVGVIIVAIVVGVVFIEQRGGDEGHPRSRGSLPIVWEGSIRATNKIEAAVNVDSTPTTVTVGGGALWVASLDAGTITRVDLVSGEHRSLSTGGHPVAIVLDEDGFVWVLNAFEATVVRIDPNRMIAERPINLSTGTKDLAAGLGAIWVTNANEGTLTRIDLVTGTIDDVELAKIGTPDGVAVGEDAMWVAGSDGVVKMDPRSLEAIDSWALRFPAGKIAVGDGIAWVTHPGDDQVTRIDDVTGPTVIHVGNGPLDLTVGVGAVWVTNSLDGTVSRIDLRRTRSRRSGSAAVPRVSPSATALCGSPSTPSRPYIGGR